MKQSDSTNSLTELNKDDPTCFVCLEIHTIDLPLVDSSILRSCGCKFNVHAPCWNEWVKQGKSDYDCPICGKRSLHFGLPLTAPLQINVVDPVIPSIIERRCSLKFLYISFGGTILLFLGLIYLIIGKK